MYIRHTLIAWARFLWSRPQTTSHVVLVRPGGDRRSCACESGNGAGAILNGTGPTRRRLTCEKDRARAEMGHEQSKHDRARELRRKQRDIASEESSAKAKNLTDTRMTLRGSLSETLQTTALPSSPLYLVPIYTLHVVTTDINLHISGYSSARGVLCACVFLV